MLSITNSGASVDSTYHAFGEVLSESGLVYTYDKNGNRTTITYPGSLLATYGYDKMDRPVWLQLKEGAATAFYVVRNSPLATYRAYGPLASLRFDLTTDRDETRSYDLRYAPTGITVSGSLFSWSYTNDLAGNVTAISQTLPAPTVSRTYGYQEWQSYLTCAAGPWNLSAASCNPVSSNPVQWTYDKVGNRLAESRDGLTDGYAYLPNAATTGNTATLDLVDLGVGGTRDYSFDAGGYLDLVDLGANQVDFGFDEAGTLGTIARPAASESLTLAYDGRGFLREADDAVTGGWLKPLYSSDGRLMSLERLPTTAGTAERINVLYFAGRPIAIWKKVGTSAATWNPIVTDHLGTPVYALTSAGLQHWTGGFEPFGRDYQQGTGQDSLTKGLFLRLPGQWDDTLLAGATLGADVFYNVHRWYESATGRFTRPDPLGRRGDPNSFAYVRSRPTFFVDPLGLVAEQRDCKCCSEFEKFLEKKASEEFTWNNWTDYAWTPAKTLGGGSCLDAASQLQGDLEQMIQPKCWISSVQLTKKSDFKICGTYVWVHYVVKYTPCDGKGDDWFFDGYTGPKSGPLDPDEAIDAP